MVATITTWMSLIQHFLPYFHSTGRRNIYAADLCLGTLHRLANGDRTLAGKLLPQTTIISRIQRNAEIYDLPKQAKQKHRGRPRKKGQRLRCPEKVASTASFGPRK